MLPTAAGTERFRDHYTQWAVMARMLGGQSWWCSTSIVYTVNHSDETGRIAFNEAHGCTYRLIVFSFNQMSGFASRVTKSRISIWTLESPGH
jgi:hypothetical protein